MPDLRKEQNGLIVASLVTIAMVAAGFVLIFAKSVLLPFVLAVFIALLISPVMDFLILKAKFPRLLAVFITAIIVLIVIAVLFLFISYAVQSVVSTAGQYSDSFVEFARHIFVKLETWKINIDQDEIIKAIQNKIPGFATNAFGTAVNIISTVFLVLLFVILLLVGRNPNVLLKGIYHDIEQQVRRYISIKLFISAITGFLVWLVLTIFGLELANVFGILTFLLNFIPSVGSVIATLLPIPVAVAQYDNPIIIILVITIPGAIQILMGNAVEPKIMGKGLHLHPITVLMALSFWGLLWGIPGMFLSVPITATIRIILIQFDTLKPLGNLLAGRLSDTSSKTKR